MKFTKTNVRLFLAVLALVGLLVAPIAHLGAVNISGNMQVQGVVPGPPPATPPSIDAPATGAVFHETPITVKGGCIAGLIVKVFRNELFAGAAVCGPDGQYSLQIDVVEDLNVLVARQYDTLNQASPDSNIVQVTFQPPTPVPAPEPTPAPAPTPAPEQPAPAVSAPEQLVIHYEYTVQGIFTDQPFRFLLNFSGGEAPYAISIDWGDGEVSVFSRQDTVQFNIDHAYKKPGSYIVKVRISDKNGRQAFLQFVVVVNGRPGINEIVSILNNQQIVTLALVGAGVGVALGTAGFSLGVILERRWWSRARLRHNQPPQADQPN